ncbi:PREDICTED: uncharacterized protein LOC108563138 [Nicrophorus vespilloides]|uniref:Uncharacterized protein LOC108563138 n=1 Tax=Nicrophorus vespilloides TaxID=110193 RepID=A0ABM1MRM0_NICVS|nr:PREDICTED: uncharacterized protein LOC108563138 [Nicrophorus vespilloides]
MQIACNIPTDSEARTLLLALENPLLARASQRRARSRRRHEEEEEIMSRVLLLVAISAFAVAVSGFGSSEDKFVKKYAMMKIYESCFGADVVKQIRKEMKAACAKCASYEAPPPPRTTTPPPFEAEKDVITDPENTVYANQQTFDPAKLHQAILSFRPNPFTVPQVRPYPHNFYGGYQGNPQFAAPQMYYQQPSPFSNPFAYPLFAQQYLGGNRVSRDMDLRSQLEAITSRMSGRVRNVTCVMQELGYLDESFEPNFEKISERIGNLPVGVELKEDIQEGVSFCKQFSQCVPEVKKGSPLSRELMRPLLFFKCYKHKKLEACIMKDVREKFSGDADVDEDDDVDNVEFRRTGKAAKVQGSNAEIDYLASSMYDFLYGSENNLDLDNLF